MDLICPRRKEPLDVAELEALVEDRQFPTVDAAFTALIEQGCGFLFATDCEPERLDDETEAKIAAVYATLGNDVDGAASMLEDFGVTS